MNPYVDLRRHLEDALREAARLGVITTPVQSALFEILRDVEFLEAVAAAEATEAGGLT